MAPIVVGTDLRKVFRAPGKGGEVRALDGVSIEVRAGELTALVGPDGAGKTTLIRLMAGLLTADGGTLRVLDIDPAVAPQRIQDRIGYMPQKFGLYEDLSVQENLDLYADLHGVSADERAQRYPQLMQMTDLGRFTRRLAGRLSGGMKQKLGLACTLVRSPELLLLDEPTVGVDPLSRRELWAIVEQLVREQGLTVLMSTSYLDEAERAARVLVLHDGKALAQSEPAAVTRIAASHSVVLDPGPGNSARSLQARLLDDPRVIDAVPDGGLVRLVCAAGSRPGEVVSGHNVTAVEPRFEDGFMMLLRGTASHEAGADIRLQRPLAAAEDGAVVEVRDLVKRFGDFTAVNHVSFDVRRGEIFGLLGPNGAGKTTTFRMLCGLLPPTGGVLKVAGVDVRRTGAAARTRLGYVAQKFSLYGALTVRENLEFFASAYGLRGAVRRERIDWAMRQFDLEHHQNAPSGELPGGFKQRLAMGAALLHEPDILFLDEPTSGADPLARRAFWRRITALAEQGVTVIVTTHFMQEAEYCDHIAIMDSGRVLAQGSPAEIRQRARPGEGRQPSMEDAFIAVVEAARAAEAPVRA
ncbi:MAG TPA: ATP-binding cassette domain-containing protein [Steroidobacteraceae bacterium]|jgi:ABC-2 type transport system ATP-binding protein|nr:ATP-binding cassette domain-containing protein [Steroidobacteraceae bacterium]